MAEVHDILQSAIERGGSDVFIIPGSCVRLKVAGEVQQLFDVVLKPDDTKRLIRQVYELDHRNMDRLTEHGDDDFSFSISGVGRFRCNAYQQRNSLAMVLRVVSLALPDPVKMHIPDEILRLADVKKGLVLVTGPAASGKSTTLACLIDRINTNRHGHIITIEDPIEFIHAHKASVLSQREVEHDTKSYQTALRAALRFLRKAQRVDGSWVPLWFGNPHAPGARDTYFQSSHGQGRTQIHQQTEQGTPHF